MDVPDYAPRLERHAAFARHKRVDAVDGDQERAAIAIEAHMRGLHDRHLIQRRHNAARMLQKVERGRLSRSSRALGEQNLATPTSKAKATTSVELPRVRAVICGCEWSDRLNQAHRLAAKLLAPCVQLQGTSLPSAEGGLAEVVRAKLSRHQSWVIDAGSLTAAQASELVSLSQPPTHWILCTIDDSEAEARGVAALSKASEYQAGTSWSRNSSSRPSGFGAPSPERDEDREIDESRRAAVLEGLREWKVRMIDVYSVTPASCYYRFDTGSAYDADGVHAEIVEAIAPPPSDTNPRGAKVRARRGAKDPKQRGGRRQPSSGGDRDSAPTPVPMEATAYGTAALRSSGARAVGSASELHSMRSQLLESINRSDSEKQQHHHHHHHHQHSASSPMLFERPPTAPSPDVGFRSSSGLTLQPEASIALSSPSLTYAPREVSVAAALERVDDVAEDWRSRSILSRLSKFSSDFVRAHVPLDGRALIAVQGASLSPAMTYGWTREASLCFGLSVVDEDGYTLSDIDEQYTKSVMCMPKQTVVLFLEDELCLTLPRAVLARQDIFLQLTLMSVSSGMRLARARRRLASLVHLSVQSRAWTKLDEDWILTEMGNAGDAGDAGGMEDGDLGADAELGLARVRSVVVDLVSAFDELYSHNMNEAAQEAVFTSEITQVEDSVAQAVRRTEAAEAEINRTRDELEATVEQLRIEADAAVQQAAKEAYHKGRLSVAQPKKRSVEVQTLPMAVADLVGTDSPLKAPPTPHQPATALDKGKSKTTREGGSKSKKPSPEALEIADLQTRLWAAQVAATEKAAEAKASEATLTLELQRSEQDVRDNVASLVELKNEIAEAAAKQHAANRGRSKTRSPPPQKASPHAGPAKQGHAWFSEQQARSTSKSPPPPRAQANASTKSKQPPAKPQRRAPQAAPEARNLVSRPAPPVKQSMKREQKPGPGAPQRATAPKRAAALQRATEPKRVVAPNRAAPSKAPKRAAASKNASPPSTAPTAAKEKTGKRATSASKERQPARRRPSPAKPLEEGLRAKLAKNLTRVMDLFRETDVNGDGSISMQEFRATIAKDPTLDATEAELQELYAAIDADASDSISFKELNRVLRRSAGQSPNSAPADGDTPVMRGRLPDHSPNRLEGDLKAKLAKNLTRVMDLFRETDVNGDGSISMQEFRATIAKDPTLDATEAELQELYAAIDADASDSISFKELNRVLRRSIRSLRPSPSRSRSQSPSRSPPPPSSQAKPVGRRMQEEADAEDGGGRPEWDNRTRVDAGPRRGGRRSLGPPVMPNPQPWPGRE